LTCEGFNPSNKDQIPPRIGPLKIIFVSFPNIVPKKKIVQLIREKKKSIIYLNENMVFKIDYESKITM